MYKEKLEQLLSQPVSRQQFLMYIGAALMSIFGVTALLKNISGISSSLGSHSSAYSGSNSSRFSAYSGVAPSSDFIDKIV